jgi:hypothetical protein
MRAIAVETASNHHRLLASRAGGAEAAGRTKNGSPSDGCDGITTGNKNIASVSPLSAEDVAFRLMVPAASQPVGIMPGANGNRAVTTGVHAPPVSDSATSVLSVSKSNRKSFAGDWASDRELLLVSALACGWNVVRTRTASAKRDGSKKRVMTIKSRTIEIFGWRETGSSGWPCDRAASGAVPDLSMEAYNSACQWRSHRNY